MFCLPEGTLTISLTKTYQSMKNALKLLNCLIDVDPVFYLRCYILDTFILGFYNVIGVNLSKLCFKIIYAAHFLKLFNTHKYFRVQTMFIQYEFNMKKSIFFSETPPFSMLDFSTRAAKIKSLRGFYYVSNMSVPGCKR